MSNDSRDEQLVALEAAVKSAESKLKSAEISVVNIEGKLKSNEDVFSQLLADKSEKYKNQTGAELVRNVDKATGKVTYDFVREATPKEQQKRQEIIFQRVYDESGKYKLKPQFVLDENGKTVTVTSAKDLVKPKERKRFIAVNMFGIRRIDGNNPFVRAVGTPLIVPAGAAKKLTEKISDSKVGKAAAKTTEIISSPVVIPAKIIKDIHDKGGIIHSVVDLGDRVRIEGVNSPKPIKNAGEIVKGAVLGIETGAVETAKSVGNFSIEIAKNKISEEINKSVSENEAAEAAYVIGMKMIDVYNILGEHSKYKKSVRRDKAGDDITDTSVSKYLAEKEEKKFQSGQDILKEKKAVADFNAKQAREEYEAAKKRLENYKKGTAEVTEKGSTSKPAITSKQENTPKSEVMPKGSVKPDTFTKTDKKIAKVKQKLKLNEKHKYKVRFKRTSSIDKNGKAKLVFKPVVRREDIPKETSATGWNTAKRLDGYAVNTGIQSMRRKAMRDGGDNSAVEAADFAVTAVQTANRTVKVLDDKERAFREKALKKKLTKLENEKSLETAASKLRERPDSKAVSKNAPQKPKKQSKTVQNKARQKKRQQNLVHSNFAKKSKEAVKDKIKELAAASVKRSGGIIVLLMLGLIVPVMFPVLGFSGSGLSGGIESFVGNAVSPCDTNDLSLSDRYYTELAKDLIEQHRNIRDYYTGYDKYTCLTDISKIDHSAQKLLPYLAVSAMSVNGSDSWEFEAAKPFVEGIFDELYELYTNEVWEVRTHVTQTSEIQDNGGRYSLGGSCYTLNGVTYDSAYYTGEAHTNTYCEAMVASGRDSVTYNNVGKYTDGNGYTHEYDEAKEITFSNYWDLKLIYE